MRSVRMFLDNRPCKPRCGAYCVSPTVHRYWRQHKLSQILPMKTKGFLIPAKKKVSVNIRCAVPRSINFSASSHCIWVVLLDIRLEKLNNFQPQSWCNVKVISYCSRCHLSINKSRRMWVNIRLTRSIATTLIFQHREPKMTICMSIKLVTTRPTSKVYFDVTGNSPNNFCTARIGATDFSSSDIVQDCEIRLKTKSRYV